MSIRYRYEITDELGVIASFTWARSMTNAQAFIDVKPSDPSREVKNPAASVTNGAIVIHTQRLKSDPGGNLLS
ncbi:Ail/Lom family outer membrane beta-barrel protein [Escherichia coli]|nr:Ail/Lom family outer membrane beta-barrel protein [Escherichia coli]MCM5388602.1 Ail/Lom family outer membrane beta-barrel protein [Escherichia coli]MDA6714499.1 Ail/Lom family outer membrane beta-barrel protein [Escherichia coli]UJY38010.1 Ail/Lom family outer membrane beta-barrel protein [Escherichia coli]